MNRSHIEHTIVAVWLQVIPGVIWGDWIIGAVLAAGWFWSREHAHNERLLRYERKHLEQIESDGHLLFALKYSWCTIRYGYWSNPYEVESTATESKTT